MWTQSLITRWGVRWGHSHIIGWPLVVATESVEEQYLELLELEIGMTKQNSGHDSGRGERHIMAIQNLHQKLWSEFQQQQEIQRQHQQLLQMFYKDEQIDGMVEQMTTVNLQEHQQHPQHHQQTKQEDGMTRVTHQMEAVNLGSVPAAKNSNQN